MEDMEEIILDAMDNANDMDVSFVGLARASARALHDAGYRKADLSSESSQALSGICVDVEELEWADLPTTRQHVAETLAGVYEVRYAPERHESWLVNEALYREHQQEMLSAHETLDAAKAACQADYAARISSCLKTRTVEEVRAEGAREERERLADLAGGCFVAVNTPEGISLGSRRPLSDWLRSQSTTEEG